MKNDFLKFSSKRNLLSAMIICCLSFAFSSCDDEEGRIKIDDSAPSQSHQHYCDSRSGRGHAVLD